MRPTDNLIGQRFGKLTVTGFAGYFAASMGAPLNAYWTCRCDCGKEMVRIKATSLTTGNTKSCGCLKRHRRVRNRLKNKWSYEMRKGNVCEEWLRYEVFKAFMERVGYTDRMRLKLINKKSMLSPGNFYFD